MCAVQQGQEFGSLWQVHDSMRLALCDAWEGSDSISILRCFLLKLTRETPSYGNVDDAVSTACDVLFKDMPSH